MFMCIWFCIWIQKMGLSQQTEGFLRCKHRERIFYNSCLLSFKKTTITIFFYYIIFNFQHKRYKLICLLGPWKTLKTIKCLVLTRSVLSSLFLFFLFFHVFHFIVISSDFFSFNFIVFFFWFCLSKNLIYGF